MADVRVTVTNKSGGVTAFTFDEDDEQIGYFRKLVKRDELDEVKVEPLKPKASGRKPTQGD